jgi:hypothetical protein
MNSYDAFSEAEDFSSWGASAMSGQDFAKTIAE